MKPSQGPYEPMGGGPPTVLIASPYAAEPGHYWKYAEHLTLALIEEGSENVAVVLNRPPIVAPARAVAAVLRVPGRRIQGLLANALGKLRQWPQTRGICRPLETVATLASLSRAECDRERVVCHFIDATFLVLWFWIAVTGRRCVCNLMGGPDPILAVRFGQSPLRWAKTGLTRRLLARCVKSRRIELCAETEAVAREWQPLAGAHVHHIPYAILPLADPMPAAAARQRLDLPGKGAVFLVFGTQRADKDIETVIRAAGLLAEPPLLLFAGQHLSGPKSGDLLARLGYENSRVIDRFLTEDESAACFAACDAVLLPYAEGYQKGSGVLVEACRHGRPVLAADTGHLGDFVRERGTGWLYACGDAADLSRRMLEAVQCTGRESALLRARIEAAARSNAWEKIVQQYLALYARLRDTPARSGKSSP